MSPFTKFILSVIAGSMVLSCLITLAIWVMILLTYLRG